MNENNFLTTITSLPLDKKTRDDIINQIIGFYLDGNTSAIEMELSMKMFEDIIKGVRGDVRVKMAVTDELQNHPKSTFKTDTFEIKLSTRRTFDMSGDAELQRLKALVKQRETFLKSIKQPTADGDGVMCEPPVEKHTEFISIKY